MPEVMANEVAAEATEPPVEAGPEGAMDLEPGPEVEVHRIVAGAAEDEVVTTPISQTRTKVPHSHQLPARPYCDRDPPTL